MYCKVCGTERNVRYRPKKLQFLCKECNKDTPKKCSYEEFCEQYWENPEEVPYSCKREFYEDYLASCCNISQYIFDTTEFYG